MGLSAAQTALTRRPGFPIPATAEVNCVEHRRVGEPSVSLRFELAA